jgi:hypothetical protein
MNILFNFEGHEVEIINFNGEGLFNPRHIGECLELTESAVRKAMEKMTQNQAIKLTNSDINGTNIRKLNNAGENFLKEAGVYKLIFKSNKPAAERFQNWLAEEVLPRIRQYGAYIPGNTPEQIIGNGISAMSGMIPLHDHYDRINYYLERDKKFVERDNRFYLDRFKGLKKDIIYDGGAIFNYVVDKDMLLSVFKNDEELNKFLINLGFIVRGNGGKYLLDIERIRSLKPLSLTYKGLVELCYAIDNPGEINFHF